MSSTLSPRRSIHVDCRYMLWNMAEVDHATNLLEEMGIVPAGASIRPAASSGAFGGR